MPPRPRPTTFAALVHAFTSFLAVAIHSILHQRDLYPPTSFLTARAYNYPVYQNRHPAVCAWVADAVAAVEAELVRNRVARVTLVVCGAACEPLERFVWDVSRFPVVAKEERETLFAPDDDDDDDDDGDDSDARMGGEAKGPIVDLEEQFRAVLAKLTVCGSVLKPLPPGCTFTVAIELKEEADPPVGHPQPWIPVQPSLQATKQRGAVEESGSGGGNNAARGDDLGGVKTTPVRAVDAGEMAFEMWIEEGKAKMRLG